MSDSEQKNDIVNNGGKVEDRDKKRGLDESDDHDSDSEDRRYKRAAVNDSNSSSPQRPQHRRRKSDDIKMKSSDAADGDVPPTMAMRSLVSSKDAGVIIGKSGKNVSDIREQSGARVTISEIVQGAHERVLTVSGPLDTVAK
ncbi:RNA binding protein, heterogenous nuclear RNP-K like protein, partial [Lunasporangiospora selenospora]